MCKRTSIAAITAAAPSLHSDRRLEGIIMPYQHSKFSERLSRHSSAHDREDLINNESPASATLSTNSILRLQRTIGNQAVLRMLNGSTPKNAVQRDLKTKPDVGIKPTDVQPVPFGEKTGTEIANGIMNKQLSILQGWETALKDFDKVITSESDKAGNPKYANVLMDFLQDKVIGVITKPFKDEPDPTIKKSVSLITDVFAIVNKLDAEMKRADAARASASIRDFFVVYNRAISEMVRHILSTRDDFVAKVRIAEDNAGKSQQQGNDYGMLLMALESILTGLDYQNKQTTPQAVYRLLTEHWINDTSLRLGDKWIGYTGIKNAFVFVRLEADYTVRDAELKVTGGQKIAEQLLKDSPGGIDPYSMKVPRHIDYFKEGSRGANTVLHVDANGKIDQPNSAGAYKTLHEKLEKDGLKPTTKLTGK
jgi:hypothetical protein